MCEAVSWLKVIVRMLGNDETRRHVKVGKTSEVLKSWCLPLMAAAIEADEKRYDETKRNERRDSIFDNLMEMAKTMGAKVTHDGRSKN